MSFKEGSSLGETNGVTNVVCLPAPPEGVCRVFRNIFMQNVDTVGTTRFRIAVLDGGVEYAVYRGAAVFTLNIDRFDGPIVLDSITKSLVIKLEAAITTNESTFIANYADCG